MVGPSAAYAEKLRRGEWIHEPAQEQLVKKLEILHQHLLKYNKKRKKIGSSIFFRNIEIPYGLYIHGGVGRGKSVLMDLFFENTRIERRRRVHFHAFMLETHSRIKRQRHASTQGDPIKYVAREISKETQLLCFDEFQVNDTADAMILQRLFKKMFERGLIMVATSNRPPNDLYKNGLNRELFLPFIELLKEKCTVFEVNGLHDYRLEKIRSMPVYFTPINEASALALDKAFKKVSGTNHFGPTQIVVQGREIIIDKSANGVGFVHFRQLCSRPLGTADYLAIAELFNTLFIMEIPLMGPEKRNEAKRFVNLIDVLYESRVNLICSAADQPSELYKKGDGSFEFDRTASRLSEMQSEYYLSQQHNAIEQD